MGIMVIDSIIYEGKPVDPATTVDGSEIWRENQLRLVVKIPLFTMGFSTIQGGCLGFLNHQKYYHWFFSV